MDVPHDSLPLPHLDARQLGAHRLTLLTDDALFRAVGVRMGFTTRDQGVSEGSFSSLNLGLHVGDRADAVHANRARLLDALGAPQASLIVPHQVHGTHLECVDDGDPVALNAARHRADQGCDALTCSVSGVTVLLNFADCLPLILAAPTGAFAVVHAGWRGAFDRIASQALAALCRQGGGCEPSQVNAYIGPHICSRCFETSAELAARFAERFGPQAAPDARHVSLAQAVRVDLARGGIDERRVCEARACTVEEGERFFSYRASGGAGGRHGAVAFREER
ncbi:laccase domain-containing protein [Eggerthellaceae bacterium zg-997]|nr:laccase domain-containing protein [Eggerthellaceae bacterium zg-997]